MIERPPDRATLESFRDAEVDDLIGPGVRLVFVGINPGLWTAAVGAHFARPGNRFWPALYRAGITERLIDPRLGMSDDDARDVVAAGIGITNLVRRASARADELTRDELAEGARALSERITAWRPKVVAMLGSTSYRQAFADRAAPPGRQERTLGGATLWVLPNPSGLNAHETLDSLARAYREAAVDAGVVLHRAL